MLGLELGIGLQSRLGVREGFEARGQFVYTLDNMRRHRLRRWLELGRRLKSEHGVDVLDAGFEIGREPRL